MDPADQQPSMDSYMNKTQRREPDSVKDEAGPSSQGGSRASSGREAAKRAREAISQASPSGKAAKKSGISVHAAIDDEGFKLHLTSTHQ